MQLKSRHLLGTEALTPEEITLILDTAESFAEVSQREIKKVPMLRGQTVISPDAVTLTALLVWAALTAGLAVWPFCRSSMSRAAADSLKWINP